MRSDIPPERSPTGPQPRSPRGHRDQRQLDILGDPLDQLCETLRTGIPLELVPLLTAWGSAGRVPKGAAIGQDGESGPSVLASPEEAYIPGKGRRDRRARLDI